MLCTPVKSASVRRGVAPQVGATLAPGQDTTAHPCSTPPRHYPRLVSLGRGFHRNAQAAAVVPRGDFGPEAFDYAPLRVAETLGSWHCIRPGAILCSALHCDVLARLTAMTDGLHLDAISTRRSCSLPVGKGTSLQAPSSYSTGAVEPTAPVIAGPPFALGSGGRVEVAAGERAIAVGLGDHPLPARHPHRL